MSQFYKEIEEIRPSIVHSYTDIPIVLPDTEDKKQKSEYNKKNVMEIIDKIYTSRGNEMFNHCATLVQYIIWSPSVTTQLQPGIYSTLISMLKNRINVIDVLRAFFQIFNYSIIYEDQYALAESFRHSDFCEVLRDLLHEAAKDQKTEVIEWILSICSISMERIKLFEPDLVRTIIAKLDITNDENFVLFLLDFINFLYEINLNDFPNEYRESTYPFLKTVLFSFESPEVIKNVLDAFKSANKIGDLFGFCLENQEILHRICELIYCEVENVDIHALMLLISLVGNGEETIDLIEPFLDLDEFFGLFSNERLDVRIQAFEVMATVLLSDDATDCKNAFIEHFSALNIDEMFSNSELSLKNKLITHIPSIIHCCDKEHMLNFFNDSLLEFICNYLESSDPERSYDVSNIMILALGYLEHVLTTPEFDEMKERVCSHFGESPDASQVTFDLMEETVNEIDTSTAEGKRKAETINRFLEMFRNEDDDSDGD